MENLTQEQVTAIKNYLTAQIVLDKHLAVTKTGYDPKLTEAVKLTVSELKKVFTQDEVDFLINAAYRSDLVNSFLK
jgi:hypothetical protein